MYEKLLQVLDDRNITRNHLAKMSGITPCDLYSALKGNKPMYPKWRKRISEALEISEGILFGDDEYNALACEVEKIAQERVFYNGGLYYVDDYDTEGIYLLRYRCNEKGFGHDSIQDEICVPLTEYKKMAVCEL